MLCKIGTVAGDVHEYGRGEGDATAWGKEMTRVENWLYDCLACWAVSDCSSHPSVRNCGKLHVHKPPQHSGPADMGGVGGFVLRKEQSGEKCWPSDVAWPVILTSAFVKRACISPGLGILFMVWKRNVGFPLQELNFQLARFLQVLYFLLRLVRISRDVMFVFRQCLADQRINSRTGRYERVFGCPSSWLGCHQLSFQWPYLYLLALCHAMVSVIPVSQEWAGFCWAPFSSGNSLVPAHWLLGCTWNIKVLTRYQGAH